MVHQAGEGVAEVVCLLGLDRHGRSHNIAAECCVGSSGERDDGLMSRVSVKAGGRSVGWVMSMGSCLMWLSIWKMWSSGDGGLAAASTVPCDSAREGAGVSLYYSQ